MNIQGIDWFHELILQDYFQAKLVFNEHGAIIFPVELEHRDNKLPGVSYEDSYEGNAMAAMLQPGKIEIRYHRDFSDCRVAEVVVRLFKQDELAIMRPWKIIYQGRELGVE